MKASNNPQFNRYYELHCKHLKLKGLLPNTIDAYNRALRRIGDYFDFQLDDLSQNQLLDYFHALLERLSWSAVKLDLYGLKFFYIHVLKKTWSDISLIKSPRMKRIPNIISVAETQKTDHRGGQAQLPGIFLHASMGERPMIRLSSVFEQFEGDSTTVC
ncbi:MAG: phage integrase N-terminal SAM-like domain-containing protein [Gammaproteobacteria bacterium]